MSTDHQFWAVGAAERKRLEQASVMVPALWIWVLKERIFYGWNREQQQTIDTHFFQKKKTKQKSWHTAFFFNAHC